MSLHDGNLTFKVINGQSQTWGRFGGRGQSVTVGSQFSDLSGYDPNVSIANSGVSFASNLVSSLTFVAVRWYDSSGTLIKQTTTPQPVYPNS